MAVRGDSSSGPLANVLLGVIASLLTLQAAMLTALYREVSEVRSDLAHVIEKVGGIAK
jgi:hypothetical protein